MEALKLDNKKLERITIQRFVRYKDSIQILFDNGEVIEFRIEDLKTIMGVKQNYESR